MERKENVAQIEFFNIRVQRDLIALCTPALFLRNKKEPLS